YLAGPSYTVLVRMTGVPIECTVFIGESVVESLLYTYIFLLIIFIVVPVMVHTASISLIVPSTLHPPAMTRRSIKNGMKWIIIAALLLRRMDLILTMYIALKRDLTHKKFGFRPVIFIFKIFGPNRMLMKATTTIPLHVYPIVLLRT
ncbi:hypothetical protein L9F63_006195, partial [Diploptera punctata]